MAYCMNCGTELEDGVCPKCTAEKKKTSKKKTKKEETKTEEKTSTEETKDSTSEKANKAFNKVVDDFRNAEDETDEYTKEDIDNNIFFAVIAYFGFLFIIPILAAPKSKYAQFHASQGLNLFILDILYGILSGVLVSICSHFGFVVSAVASGITGLAGLFIFILFIQGIANAATRKARKLPYIGDFEILKVD